MKDSQGLLDDSTMVNQQQNDAKSKSEMRRTRIKMLFEDFQGEIEYLESQNKDLVNENKKIQSENDEVQEQMKDLESRYLHSLKRSASELERGQFQNGGSSSGTDNLNGDIHTILKLSSKLQEVMSINETMAQTNCNLKSDIKCLRQEKQQNLEEIKTLKEQQKLIDSPQRYNKYTVVALQTKADGYEREIKHLKKALKRSDEYIEKLTTEIDIHKRHNTQRKSPNYATSSSNRPDNNESSIFGAPQSNGLKMYSGVANSFNKNMPSASATLQNMSSASATLQSLVRYNGQGLQHEEQSAMSKIWNPTQQVSPKDTSMLPDNVESTSLKNTKKEQGLISNPSRFPACAKLLELSKQHDNTLSDKNASPSPTSRSDPGQINQQTATVGASSRHSLTPESPIRSPVVNYPSSSIPASREDIFPSSQIDAEHQHVYQRENETDEITIVMPSTEGSSHWLQSINQHGGRSSAENHRQVNNDDRSSSPAWHQTSRFNNKSNRIALDVSLLSSKEQGLFSPAKKIKTEICYE